MFSSIPAACWPIRRSHIVDHVRAWIEEHCPPSLAWAISRALDVVPSRRRSRERLLRIVDAVSPEGKRVVQRGPFEGMGYTNSLIGSALPAKLIGSFEQELHPVIEHLDESRYDQVVNIGSGEGFYAIGLTLRLGIKQMHAFETISLERHLCRKMAQLNGVSERVIIHGTCDTESLRRVMTGMCLVFIDCEGCEFQILDPIRVPQLRDADILVELHEAKAGISRERLFDRFSDTHAKTEVPIQLRDPAQFSLPVSLGEDQREYAVSEGRSESGGWAFLQARRRPGEAVTGQPTAGATG